MVYLYYGANDFARKHAINALKALIPADVADLNLTVLDGKAAKPADIHTACAAYPLLHDRRLVIARDALKQARSSEAREALRSAIKAVPDTTDLVLDEADAPDQRLALIKDLHKQAQAGHAEIREFKPLEGVELVTWVVNQAREQNVTLRTDAAQHLIDYVGTDSWMLHNEISKLAAYVSQGGTITSAEVDLLVTDETETNLFAFIDALCGRHGDQALQHLHGLLTDGVAPLYILTMIARQARLMLLTQQAGRMNPNDLARLIGQKPFVARKAAEQARLFTPAELQTFHDQVLSSDHGIKTGQFGAEAALEILVATFGYAPRQRR